MSERTNPWLRPQETQVLSFSPTAEVRKLEPVQKANQKIVLSYYGLKIDMPFKLTNAVASIRLIDTRAVIPAASHEVVESRKLELIHPLGTTYARLDVPLEKTASQMTADAFSLAELNMRSKREFEDYLINRKQYDLDFSSMDLSHRQARLARKYEYVNKGIDLVLGFATAVVPTFKFGRTMANLAKSNQEAAYRTFRKNVRTAGRELHPAWLADKRGLHNIPYTSSLGNVRPSKMASSVWTGANQEMSLVLGLGAYKGYSSMASGITGLIAASETASLQEEGFGIEIGNKALQSYQIDLSYERDKEDQLMTMRRLFANESYNEVTSRQRQKALDELETPPISDEIYLELWTVSDDQKKYVEKYHDKFGIDCRVADYVLNVRDDIRKGIYCIEDVVIENLEDRLDFEILRARLIGGIKFIEWIESKKAKEITVDSERVLEVRRQLATVRQQLQQAQEAEHRAEASLVELRMQSDQAIHARDEAVERYSHLSKSYTQQEEELRQQKNLVVLYKDEAGKLRQDLIKETHDLASEIEGHKATQGQLQEKTQENQTLTQQIDRQTIEIQEKERQLDDTREKNRQYLSEIRRTIHALRGTIPAGITFPVTIKGRQITREEELIRESNFQEDLKNAQEYLSQELQKEKTKLEEATSSKAQLQQEKERQETQIQQNQQQLQAKDNQIQELTSENERLKTKLQTRPTDTEVKGCQTSILELPKLVKYILIGCGANYKRTVISNFNENTKTWINNKNKKIVRDTSTKQVKILDFKTPIRGTSFDNVVKTYEHYKELLDQSYTWLGGQEFNTNSEQMESGIPFFETPPRSKTDKLGCERWFKDGQWYHKEVVGATKITNYGEYLDALGLVFENGKAITIKEKLTEVEESLAAVRKLETEKNREIEELKARPVANLFREWSYNFWQWNMELRTSGAGDDGVKQVILNPLYLVINKGSDYEIIKFNPDIKVFLVAQRETDGSKYRILRYPAYNIFTIGPLSNREEETVDDVWKGYVSSYFTEVQTTWEQLDNRKIRYDCASAVKGTVRFLHVTAVVPYFETKGLIKTIERAGDSEEEEAHWKIVDGQMIFTYYKLANFKPIYWDPEWKNFTYKKDSKYTKINNFKDYKRVLNITETEFKTPEGINIVETEEDYQKLLEQGALSI